MILSLLNPGVLTVHAGSTYSQLCDAIDYTGAYDLFSVSVSAGRLMTTNFDFAKSALYGSGLSYTYYTRQMARVNRFGNIASVRVSFNNLLAVHHENCSYRHERWYALARR
jgi:hypothetical protein